MKNEVKNATRHLVTQAYDTFVKDKHNVSVVSLPGNVWELENHILSNHAFSTFFDIGYELDMTLAEKNSTIFNSHNRGKTSFLPINVNSSYVLKQPNVTYKNEYLNESHIQNCKSNNIFAWFDFCGNPTTENLNLVNTAKDKNVTFIFTFNTAWRMDSNVDSTLRYLATQHNKSIATHAYLTVFAKRLGLSLIWSFEYVANHTPMISVCFSNDANVLANKSLQVYRVNTNKKSHVTNRDDNNINKPISKATKIVKRDLSAVYVDVKAGIDKHTICTKHNISAGTFSSVKAWITMGK
jgi:hypothetical protein